MCQKFANKGKEIKSACYFFPRRHEVLVGFEDVCQSFFDVFLLRAGQHSRRQEQRQAPLLSVEGERLEPKGILGASDFYWTQ